MKCIRWRIAMGDIVGAGLLFLCFVPSSQGQDYPWLSMEEGSETITIEHRIPVPPGYVRIDVKEGSFAQWLRGLPLKEPGAKVCKGDGSPIYGQSSHVAVVDMDVLRFQECADSVMRLRAEYLRSRDDHDAITFNFVSGDPCPWPKWREGWRIGLVDGKVTWRKRAEPDSSRKAFVSYLEKVFEYASTLSLARDLQRVSAEELAIGDVIVQGGSPGHVVMILDAAVNDRGEAVYLLGQGFMPAQDFHVIRNPGRPEDPWYEIQSETMIETVAWTFREPGLMSFNMR